METNDMMKSTFSDTILVAILSFTIYLSEVRDWVAVVVGVFSTIWIIIQIIWRIQNWNK
ncbi:MAG: hypothetical protein GDA37_08095 [Ekhidna sp.]|nr:hypothetical protein [Ekhidna sp.]